MRIYHIIIQIFRLSYRKKNVCMKFWDLKFKLVLQMETHFEYFKDRRVLDIYGTCRFYSLILRVFCFFFRCLLYLIFWDACRTLSLLSLRFNLYFVDSLLKLCISYSCFGGSEKIKFGSRLLDSRA